MHRLARKAPATAIALAAGMTVATPALGQLGAIELTQQEYYKLRLTAAEDVDGLRSLLRAIEELPPELEDMLLAFQRELLRSRDAAEYMYERYGGTIDRRSDFAQALADGILVQTEIVLDGIFRLPADAQEEYLDFVRVTFAEIAANETQICTGILEGSMSTLDYARIDYIGYRTLGTDGLAALLDLYAEAFQAEFEQRPPALDLGRDQQDEGAAALEAAALELLEGSPLAARISEADDVDDLTGEDICALTTIVFDAFDTLDQPERNWALRAVLANQGF